MHIEDGMRSGLSEAEARRQAMIQLGGLEQTKAGYRGPCATSKEKTGAPLST
jgi:hypothetical protein